MNLEGYDIKKPCCIHLSPLFYFFAVARQYLFVFNRYCDPLTHIQLVDLLCIFHI